MADLLYLPCFIVCACVPYTGTYLHFMMLKTTQSLHLLKADHLVMTMTKTKPKCFKHLMYVKFGGGFREVQW